MSAVLRMRSQTPYNRMIQQAREGTQSSSTTTHARKSSGIHLGITLRLKAAIALVIATLSHPTQTSRIILDPSVGSVRVEYERRGKAG